MYAWRYLLLAIPSAGLLGPAALAWTLGRFDWKQAALSVLLALPLWLLAAYQPYLSTGLLWFVGLVALTAWVGGNPRQPATWGRAAGLVLGHVLLALGLAVLGVGLLAGAGATLRFPAERLWVVGGLLTLAGLVLMEWMMALSWHGINFFQAVEVFRYFSLPVHNLADLIRPDVILSNLSSEAWQKFSRVHAVSADWLLLGHGAQVSSTYLHFSAGQYVDRALNLKKNNELLGVYLLSAHHRMSPTAFTPVRPVLQLPHPVLGPGFPVYEIWPVQHWHVDEERLELKAAYRYLIQVFGQIALKPTGIMLDGSVAELCLDDRLHPALAMLEYNVVDWPLEEALGPRPEHGEAIFV